MRVIISAGGTGGHIFPALSIINKIKQEESDSEFLYIGTTDRMEHVIIPEHNIPYVGIEMKGLSKNLVKSLKSVGLLTKSISKIKKLIKEFNPDIVIGVGGYITFPVIYSAKKLGYKTFIHEQNSIPGKSNKLLSRYTDKIAVSLPGSINYFPKDKVVLTGNPRSSEVIKAKKASKKELGLTKDKTILIVMGSLGSMTINKELKKMVLSFNKKNYDVILVTGKNYYDDFKDLKTSVKIVPFLDNMLNVLKICDLIITRAGASTIAEITAIGLPSILVPSPYVANNHQYYNAMELVNNKASILLEEKDFNEENLLKQIDLVLNNPKLLDEMHQNSLKLGVKDSTDRIYQILKELVGDYGKNSK